jgi:hypothetical protein
MKLSLRVSCVGPMLCNPIMLPVHLGRDRAFLHVPPSVDGMPEPLRSDLPPFLVGCYSVILIGKKEATRGSRTLEVRWSPKSPHKFCFQTMPFHVIVCFFAVVCFCHAAYPKIFKMICSACCMSSVFAISHFRLCLLPQSSSSLCSQLWVSMPLHCPRTVLARGCDAATGYYAFVSQSCVPSLAAHAMGRHHKELT